MIYATRLRDNNKFLFTMSLIAFSFHIPKGCQFIHINIVPLKIKLLHKNKEI